MEYNRQDGGPPRARVAMTVGLVTVRPSASSASENRSLPGLDASNARRRTRREHGPASNRAPWLHPRNDTTRTCLVPDILARRERPFRGDPPVRSLRSPRVRPIPPPSNSTLDPTSYRAAPCRRSLGRPSATRASGTKRATPARPRNLGHRPLAYERYAPL